MFLCAVGGGNFSTSLQMFALNVYKLHGGAAGAWNFAWVGCPYWGQIVLI